MGYRKNSILFVLYCLLVLPIGPCYSLVEEQGPVIPLWIAYWIAYFIAYCIAYCFVNRQQT